VRLRFVKPYISYFKDIKIKSEKLALQLLFFVIAWYFKMIIVDIYLKCLTPTKCTF
jgi:hypothetical protein